MNTRCVCFTTDLGYLFPTLLSAVQARKNLDESADVIIILFWTGATVAQVFQDVCATQNIIFLIRSPQILQGFTTMYARLFLCELLPVQYAHILYVDGDVQIAGSLNPVIAWRPVGPEVFCAVADPMAVELIHDETRQDIRGYFESLGVKSSPRRPYFNSGALRIERPGWADVSLAALKLLREKPELCRWQDQSALNFAGKGKFVPMSFQWNFPIFFRNCGVEQSINPRIYHFMSKPKPWQGNFPPWGGRFVKPYLQLVAENPALAPFHNPLPFNMRLKYFALQNYKKMQELLSWRLSGRRQAILDVNAAAEL
jgi:lipopolysaccharide biosynthesis glycosyltransferase